MKKQSGRVIGIFGLPCSGKSTLSKAITNSSREVIAHVSTGDIVRQISTDEQMNHIAEGNLFPDEDKIRAEVAKIVEKRRSQGAEVVLLDGCPRFDDQVKWMIEQQWLGSPDDGMIIQVRGDDLIKRALNRNRDNQDDVIALEKKIAKHQKMINKMEKVIFFYGIPYYTVMNVDLLQAATHMAKLIGLRK